MVLPRPCQREGEYHYFMFNGFGDPDRDCAGFSCPSIRVRPERQAPYVLWAGPAGVRPLLPERPALQLCFSRQVGPAVFRPSGPGFPVLSPVFSLQAEPEAVPSWASSLPAHRGFLSRGVASAAVAISAPRSRTPQVSFSLRAGT